MYIIYRNLCEFDRKWMFPGQTTRGGQARNLILDTFISATRPFLRNFFAWLLAKFIWHVSDSFFPSLSVLFVHALTYRSVWTTTRQKRKAVCTDWMQGEKRAIRNIIQNLGIVSKHQHHYSSVVKYVRMCDRCERVQYKISLAVNAHVDCKCDRAST